MSEQTTDVARRDRGLAQYLDAMDNAGGGVYTQDFREGFRHALAMVAAYESDEATSPGHVRPEVREAARAALARRSPIGHDIGPRIPPAATEEADRG